MSIDGPKAHDAFFYEELLLSHTVKPLSIRLTLLAMNVHSSKFRKVPISCEVLLLTGLCETKPLLDT